MPNDAPARETAPRGTRAATKKWVPETRRRRVPVQFPMTFVATGDEHRRVGVVVNVSTGGLFVQSALLLPVGAALRVSLFLPLAAGPKPLAAAAWVRWTNDPLAPKAAGLPPGMGIEFLDLDAAARGALDAFVSERWPESECSTTQ